MVFRAQGESPASCARERGLNPAAPMLQHILKKIILLITEAGAEAGPGFRSGAGIGFFFNNLQQRGRVHRSRVHFEKCEPDRRVAEVVGGTAKECKA